MTLTITRPYHHPDYKIITESKHISKTLYLQFGKYITERDSKIKNIIIITETSDSYYEVEYNSKTVTTNRPLAELENILYENTTYDKKVITLHGAAVEKDGKAYVFLARTTTGKTTLAAYLNLSGCGYVTEDCVLIDRATAAVYPYACPVHLRAGGVEVLKKHNVELPELKVLHDPIGDRYVYSPENVVTSCTPLEGIYFIERSDKINRIEKISPQAAAVSLMKSSLSANRPDADYVKAIMCIANANCYSLTYCDMKYVLDIIGN